MSIMDDVLGGFGFSQPNVVADVAGGTVSGAASGVSGGGWGAAIGAIGGAVGSYFESRAAAEQYEAARDVAELQLQMVQAGYRGGGGQAPAYTAPRRGDVMYTQPAGYQPGRAYPTPGDTYGGGQMIMDPYQQAMLTSGFVGPMQGVVQPGTVGTGPAGLPYPGQSAVGAVAPGGLFGYGAQTARPIREIQQVNPATGKIHVWRHMGRALLYSGDLAACKRVTRISKRVARAAGTRSRRRP